MDWKIKSIGNFDTLFKSFGKFDQIFESNTFYFYEFLGVANFCPKICLNI